MSEVRIFIEHDSKDYLLGKMVGEKDKWMLTLEKPPFEIPGYKLEKKIIRTINDLPPVLKGALPDAWGFRVINHIDKKLIENVGAIMSFLGQSGAWKFLPVMEGLDPDTENAKDILWVREQILKFEKSIPSDLRWMIGSANAGGARPKFYIDLDHDNNIVLNQPSNKRSYILKLVAKQDSDDAILIEYAIYQAALKCGLKMPESRLIQRQGFASKRFDMNKDKTFNLAVTFAAINGGEASGQSYEKLIETAYTLCTKSQVNFPKEIAHLAIFNYLIENCDDHARNISFIYKYGQWELAPFYDLTNSFLQSGHEMSVNNTKFPEREDFIDAFVPYGVEEYILDELIESSFNALKESFVDNDFSALFKKTVEYRYSILTNDRYGLEP